MPSYTNQDGLEVRFGSDIGQRGAKAGVTTGAGKRRELVLEVDLTDLPATGTLFTADLNNDGTNEAFNSSNTPLPIGVRIEDVSVAVLEAAAGGGTAPGITVGTFQENGTVVDADGIATDINGTAGAQVGAVVSDATGPWFVAVTKAGTAVYTAGRVKIVVEFITQ